jgi:hypothetical protein
MTLYPDSAGFKEHGGTSELAAGKIEKSGKAATLRAKVLATFNFLDSTGMGLTADEVSLVLSQPVLSIRPRVSELFHKGLLEKTAQVRPNATGSLCRVFRRKV